MKKKFFVSSDIHGAYSLWMQSLEEAGFDETNEDHMIIVCGDAFDRFHENTQVYNFIKKMLEKEKMIYIRGNHETLMEELINRSFFKMHDIHNGTFDTVCELGEINKNQSDEEFFLPDEKLFYAALLKTKEKLFPLFKQAVWYYETEKYIFCHSFIPCKINEELSSNDGKKIKFTEYDPEWRDCNNTSWAEASWVNPYKYAKSKLNKTGKTIVSGHWSTSSYWSDKENRSEYGKDAKFDIVNDKKLKLINLDGCVAISKHVNIIVIEDELLGIRNNEQMCRLL